MSLRMRPGRAARRRRRAAWSVRLWAWNPVSRPDVQLPPPEVPQPRPDCGIPMTDGTPAACRQKNAAEFLAGRSPGVMTQYGDGLFGAEQHLHSREPAPDEDQSGVLQLVEWREEAPYG